MNAVFNTLSCIVKKFVTPKQGFSAKFGHKMAKNSKSTHCRGF